MKWEEIRVGDYLTVLTDYHANGAYQKLKKNVVLKYEPDYAVMIRTLNFERSDFTDDLLYLNEREYHFLAKSKVKPYDIIMNKIANAGSIYLMPDLNRPVSLAMNLFLLRFDERVHQRFIFYLMKINEPYIKTFANGSATKTITKQAVRNLIFKIPPLPIQRKIASILSAYDDLIENNLKRIALLEKFNKLLYEEWFVRLRFPGHEHTKIVDEMPEGWESGLIEDFYETSSGGTPNRTKPDFYSGDINWIKTQELDGKFIFESEERITEEAIRKSSAKVFPAQTVIVSIYGGTNIGRTGILVNPASTNQACCALFPKQEWVCPYYTLLKFQNMRSFLINLSQGAAQTNISQQVIKGLKAVMPTKSLTQNFSDAVTPAFEQIKNLQQQNQKLKQARDILLPKLINGQIAV